MSRGRALGVGLVVAGAYALLAMLSGHLSPLARGPLLDGLAPVNYRWVNPPPELAPTNQEPTSGTFSVDLTPQGIEGTALFTSDGQVTINVPAGTIAPSPGQQSVELRVEPLDPATLPPPDGELTVFGNAYEISAAYEPSGKRVKEFRDGLAVSVIYPATATLHSTAHDMLWSADGGPRWDALDTQDALQLQQVRATVPDPGFITVAGVLSPSPEPVPASDEGSGGQTTLAVVLLVLAGCALLVGIGLLLRSRRP